MQAAEYHHFGFYTSALAVNLLDRFMASQPTSDEELWTLQLAAVACLSIAAKMEEGIMPADIAELQVGSPPHDRIHIDAALLHAQACLSQGKSWCLLAEGFMQMRQHGTIYPDLIHSASDHSEHMALTGGSALGAALRGPLHKEHGAGGAGAPAVARHGHHSHQLPGPPPVRGRPLRVAAEGRCPAAPHAPPRWPPRHQMPSRCSSWAGPVKFTCSQNAASPGSWFSALCSCAWAGRQC